MDIYILLSFFEFVNTFTEIYGNPGLRNDSEPGKRFILSFIDGGANCVHFKWVRCFTFGDLTALRLERKLCLLKVGPLRDFVAVALPHRQGAQPPVPQPGTEFLDIQPGRRLVIARSLSRVFGKAATLSRSVPSARSTRCVPNRPRQNPRR